MSSIPPIIGTWRTLSCSVPGRVPPGGHKDAIEYTAEGEYVIHLPEDFRRLSGRFFGYIKCEYSEGKVTHFYRPDGRRVEFLYTIENNDLLTITTVKDGSIWKLERVQPTIIRPMNKIVPCLWFNGQAEEAAKFYTSLLPDSYVDRIFRSPVDTHSGPAGSVLTVEFVLAGQRYLWLNGGSQFPFTEAVSFQIHTEDQQETDRLWDALTANGGEGVACSWLKDRWGLRWQIVPKRLTQLIQDPDIERSRRAMTAMMGMVKIDIAALERAVEQG